MAGDAPMRRHGQGVYLALKAAVRHLTDLAGTLDAAVSYTRVQKSVIQEYGSPTSGLHMPIDVVADLEAGTGDPVVSRALARIAGYALERAAPASPAPPPARSVRLLTAELGRLAADYDAATVRGERLSPNDQRQLCADLQQLISTAQGMADSLVDATGRNTYR